MDQSTDAKKSLGQHWLNDPGALLAIVEAGNLQPSDVVLEVGPGHGSLTKLIADRVASVVAIEKDELLAKLLDNKVRSTNLEVRSEDILTFDLTTLPPDYKVVANIPYYLTSNLLRVMSESTNPPSRMVLLVQKEVAERVASGPGQMSLLSVSVQLYYKARLGVVVPAYLFDPAPKVDSQVLILQRYDHPLFPGLDTKLFFQIVKAGFAGKRKMLRGSLSAGLNIEKDQAEKLLSEADIDPELRPQVLSTKQWYELYLAAKKLALL